MGWIATIGVFLKFALEVLYILKDAKQVKSKEENDKLEIRKQEIPVFIRGIQESDTTAYLLSLSRMRNARKG